MGVCCDEDSKCARPVEARKHLVIIAAAPRHLQMVWVRPGEGEREARQQAASLASQVTYPPKGCIGALARGAPRGNSGGMGGPNGSKRAPGGTPGGARS